MGCSIQQQRPHDAAASWLVAAARMRLLIDQPQPGMATFAHCAQPLQLLASWLVAAA